MLNISVTPRAVDELKKAVTDLDTQETVNGVRVMVQGACGCGNAHFAMGFDEAQPEDNRIDLGGVTLLVDPESAPYLDSAQVDYSDDLMQRGFRINAPQSGGGGGGCGCGGHGHAH